MEDLATLEISRAQTWQWLRQSIILDDGTPVTPELVEKVFGEELAKITAEVQRAMSERGDAEIETELAAFDQAKRDAAQIFTETTFRPFLSACSELVHELVGTDPHTGGTTE